MPHLTALRCRACSVLGGTTVETDEEAAQLNEIPRIRLAIADGRQPAFVAGAFASLPHCLKSDEALATFAKRHGRPCPRVELMPENATAVNLVTMTIREDVRPFVAPYFEASQANASEDSRRRLLARVARTLTDKEVSEALYPPQKGNA